MEIIIGNKFTLIKHYFSGVYASLQQGHTIQKDDIEIVINHICSEMNPLEIDITEFLTSSCGHVYRFIEKYNMEQTTKEDIMRTFPTARELVGDIEDPLLASRYSYVDPLQGGLTFCFTGSASALALA